MMLLTIEQADQVRGDYGLFSALNPIQFVEGFCLPLTVLDDVEFSSVHEFLLTLPIQEVTPIEPPEPPKPNF